MKMKYRKNNYKKAEIKNEFKNNKKIIFGLINYSWQYIKSITINKLKINKKILLNYLKLKNRDYIFQT